MNTTEKNILVARFVGMKPLDEKEIDGFWTNLIKAHKYDSVMNLQFDTDWNWIMYAVKECFLKNEMAFEKQTDILNESLNEVDIDCVFNAVVEFIKAYNSKQS